MLIAMNAGIVNIPGFDINLYNYSVVIMNEE